MEAIAACERAIALCAAAGQQALAFLAQAPVPLLTTFTHVGLMLCQKFRGRWRAAIAHSEQARDVGVIAGDDGLAAFAVAPTDYFRGWALAHTAIARCAGGEDAEALGILDYAVGLARDAGHVSGSTLIALALSEARPLR